MPTKKPLASDRYGRLTGFVSVSGGWRCQCDCGNTVIVSGTHLRMGNVVSCGCYHAQRQREVPLRHGMKHTAAYRAWVNMRQRCSNPRKADWPNYGGRGIRVCSAWQVFENFLSDMGQPLTGQTLDRIDSDGPYQSSNCRWVTRTVQNRNKRDNRLITLAGVTKTLADWCEERGLNYWTVHARLRRGASHEKALSA